MKGRIHSINISKHRGIAKKQLAEAVLKEDYGLLGDAHAGPGDKQVSLLAIESIRKQKECLKVKKPNFNLGPGDFAENITTAGLDLSKLKIGSRLIINDEIILRISRIGKECHRYCSIYYKTGDCIMPREGIFATVIKGGRIKTGSKLEVQND